MFVLRDLHDSKSWLKASPPNSEVHYFVVPENIHTSPTEGIGNSGEEGRSQRPKTLKQCMKLNWNFQRVGGHREKSLPWGVWIFSGTTYCVSCKHKLHFAFKVPGPVL